MQHRALAFLAATALAAGCAQASPPSAATPAPAPAPLEGNRALIFADEFDGTALDRAKWNVIGPDFWVNNEQQAYVDGDARTIRIAQGLPGADGGALVLTPVFDPGKDPKAERKADFLSGRVDTRGKFDFAYGRAEARIRMTDVAGSWPAFWLLGNGKWPATGEIDIMEYVGEKDWIGVALHGPGYSGETPLVDKYFFPRGSDVTTWHTYAVEWTPDRIEFLVDDRLTYRVTRPMVENYGKWSFDTPKHVILNFAVGGAYPEKTNGVKKPYPGLPQEGIDGIKAGKAVMEVDWVRVWGPRRD